MRSTHGKDNALKPLLNEGTDISEDVSRSFGTSNNIIKINKDKRVGIFNSNMVKGEANLYKHPYGETGGDSSDEDSAMSPSFKQKIQNATPMTKRRLKSEHDLNEAGKIGPLKTFFTLIKGFVATGVLFLPKGWRNGGWMFSTGAMIGSCILTIITSLKLLEVRK